MSRNSCATEGLSVWRNPEEYENHFDFEKWFSHVAVNKLMLQHFPKVCLLTFVYVLVIHAGQRYMKNRPAYKLHNALLLWNVMLALFSIVAFIRTFGEMGRLHLKHGFHFSICDLHSIDHRNMIGVWTFLFVISKIVELGDTAFIVLRKTPLIFLHWYHHVATLLFVWYCCVNLSSLGRWFQVINLFVHSIMYSYYALKALKVKVPSKISMAITSVQLLQMVGGIVMTVYAYRMKLQGDFCCVNYKLIFFAWGMYLSYFLLFLNFFIKSYIGKKSSRGKSPVIELNQKKVK